MAITVALSQPSDWTTLQWFIHSEIIPITTPVPVCDTLFVSFWSVWLS
jgi:hypothetical protein